MYEQDPQLSILKTKYRSHTCGELRHANVGQEVTLSGWLMRKRDHGGVLFIDLRDHYGITQIVFPSNLLEAASKLRVESVLSVRGLVKAREGSLINPKISTGEIEVQAQSFDLLSACEVLPFQIAEDDNAPEATRLSYRFLELRREELHAHIMLRTKVIRALRDIMHELGFAEFHTPILTSSSPEGARDFIVPSRLHPGKFYALPQAPQQFKQLIMMAGFDRYFQIAPCFRDEDARADRSPGEFYQIDMELSFVEKEDVLNVNEALMSKLFARFSNRPITAPPFPRFSYKEAMERFGSDKPDLRIPFEITNLSELFAQCQFKIFREGLDRGEGIRALAAEVPSMPPRKFFDDLTAQFQKDNGFGLAYLAIEAGQIKGNIAKFLSEAEVAALKSNFPSSGIRLLFLSVGEDKRALPALGRLRNELPRLLNMQIEDAWKFCWVTDFPFYEQDPESGALQFGHNPFSMPQGGMQSLNEKAPLDILASQYDLVLNGNELASGAIRNHSPEVMYRAFEIVGYTREMVDAQFSGMIRAFRFGAPPHGGIAHGVERIVMLLAGEEAIREVIMFPLAQNGEDLLMNAPSEVSPKQLREVHIKLDIKKA